MWPAGLRFGPCVLSSQVAPPFRHMTSDFGRPAFTRTFTRRPEAPQLRHVHPEVPQKPGPARLPQSGPRGPGADLHGGLRLGAGGLRLCSARGGRRRERVRGGATGESGRNIWTIQAFILKGFLVTVDAEKFYPCQKPARD